MGAGVGNPPKILVERMRGTFLDRIEAGRALADAVAQEYYSEPLVLALPRGGVPVAAEIARALSFPLDVLLVRKIGTPGQPELALGAVVDGNPPQVVINDHIRRHLDVPDEAIEAATQVQVTEIERRRNLYLQGRRSFPVKDRTVIVVDDGIATGATMRVALKALRLGQPDRLVLAVPVAPRETIAMLETEVDDCICLSMPEPFHAVGLHYRNFDPVSDQEVAAILEQLVVRQRSG